MAVNLLAVVAVCILHVATSRTFVTYAPQEGPNLHVGADGVSASVGGYKASAGLGGRLADGGAGGGLFARAEAPGGVGAAAGLGGTVNADDKVHGGLFSGASAGEGGHGGSAGGGFIGARKPPINQRLYDDIFNIPTSILGSVQRLLNNFAGTRSTDHKHTSAQAGAAASADWGLGTRYGAGAATNTGTIGSSSSPSREPGSNVINDIFNIPVTALRAVNQLLNNKNGK